jgi:integrase
MGGRPATGQVLKPGKGQRSFALRVWAYGKREYITLGRPEDGLTLRQAERELAVVLRDIDLGVWKPSRPEPARVENDPLFHEFASEWFAAKQPELAPNTARSYRNDLTKHLLPFFAEHTLSQITISEVDRYRQEKVHEAARLTAAAEEGKTRTVVVVDRRGRSYKRSERPLSNRSINMHIDVLSQILALADDHGHIPSNPARGKRRRLKVTKARPVYLDSAEHIAVMLEAAGELDRDPKSRTKGRRAAIALLMLGGPRASSAGALIGRDQDLANGRIEIAVPGSAPYKPPRRTPQAQCTWAATSDLHRLERRRGGRIGVMVGGGIGGGTRKAPLIALEQDLSPPSDCGGVLSRRIDLESRADPDPE